MGSRSVRVADLKGRWQEAEEAAGDDAGGDEGAGFGAVDGFDEFGGGGDAFGLDVHDLAADHAGRKCGVEVADAAYAGADGEGDFAEDGDGGGGWGGELGDGLEGEGLEGVAGEDGGGFAEDDVAGGLAAAEVVVVEGGEVVVDEGVGVEHLEGGAEIGCACGESRGCLRPSLRLPCRGWGGDVCRRRRCCGAWRGGWSEGGCRVRAGGVRGRHR